VGDSHAKYPGENKASERADDSQNEQRHCSQTRSNLLNKGCPASTRQTLVLEGNDYYLIFVDSSTEGTLNRVRTGKMAQIV
jgi:hypothetical protein